MRNQTNWFLAIAYKSWFFKKNGGVFEKTVSKTANQFLLNNF
jgi:hypothetical protein